MKKHLLALLLAIAAPAALAGTDLMVAQCQAVMRCDICRIEKDTQPRPNGVLVTIKDTNGKPVAKRVSSEGYNWLRNAGSEQLPDGTYVMCARVAQAMAEPATSEHNITARSMFDANWVRQEYCPPTADRNRVSK